MGKSGVLLLAHGSRAPEAAQTMVTVTDLVRARCPGIAIETAYMEFCDVNIEKGLNLLRETGVSEVKVIPYFLFDGIHLQRDIPSELADYQRCHPEMNITLGRPLGTDPRLADIVADQIG